MKTIFEGLEGVRVYIDDVIIWAESKEQLLHKALERVHRYGLKLNREKCQFRGHVSGRQIDICRSAAR